MTKPTDTTEGIELPTEPGVWKRKEGDWAIIVRRASTAVGEALVFSGMKGDKFACGFLSGLPLDDDFPRGGWLPATPAPADEAAAGEPVEHLLTMIEAAWRNRALDGTLPPSVFANIESVARKIRQHFRCPAPEELPRVDGRFPYIAEIAGQFFIRSKVYVEEWAYVCLSSGGKWQPPYCQENYWPTREAAIAFIRQHADQPAAVSPDASARTFEDWRNDEADDATAATAEQGKGVTAEAKLAFLKTKGLTVGEACDSGSEPYLAYVIEPGSELDDANTIAKNIELELQLTEARRRLLSAAGDDLCRLTQEEIKAYTSGEVQIPPKEEFIASCERFHAQIAAGPGVLSNCLTLAQLIAENERLKEQLAAAERKNDGMQLQLNSMEKLVAESSPGRIASLKDRCRGLENALNDSPGHEPVAMSAFQRCFNVRNYFEQRALAAEAELATLKRQVEAKGEQP